MKRCYTGGAMIDAHAHLHPRFRLEAFLDGAAEQFRRAAAENGLPPDSPGCLLLADGHKRDSFPRWGEGGIDRSCRAWTSEPTGEEGSVLARRKDGAVVLLVAGRQVRARGGAEILLLGARGDFPAGERLEETARRGLDAGALVVLPWGLGKWWGARGNAARRFLLRGDPARLFLGDTSNRLAAGREPSLLREGRRLGFRVLPGTDPFPFRSQERRAGRYGFLLDGAPEPERPFASIRDRLIHEEKTIRAYGRRDRLVPFLLNQAAMQIRKERR